MPERRRQINRRAVRQMVRLVKALIWILLAALNLLALLVLIAAMNVLAGTIGTGGVWREERLERPCSEVPVRRTTSSPVARERSPEIWLRQLLERGATTSTGVTSQLVQEPQTTGSEEIISEGGRIRPLDTSFCARLSLERKLREELRQLEEAMSEKLKLGEKGKKRMEEAEEGIKIKENEEEEEEEEEEDNGGRLGGGWSRKMDGE